LSEAVVRCRFSKSYDIRARRLSQSLVSAPQHIIPVTGVRSEEIPHVNDPISTHRQRGGESHARKLFGEFLSDRIEGYETRISSPITAWDGCSRLSPHLAYGCISSREIIKAIFEEKKHASNAKTFSLDAFEQRIAWRDHFMQKLESNPTIETCSYFSAFDDMRSRIDQHKLDAWIEGRTGFPFVDACLRSLAATGWINFRMRAMLVSFAANDLWLPWQSFASQLANEIMTQMVLLSASGCQKLLISMMTRFTNRGNTQHNSLKMHGRIRHQSLITNAQHNSRFVR